MYRVVYNTCYGGFSISLKCYLWLKENGLLTDSEIEGCEMWIKHRVEIHTPEKYHILVNSKNKFVEWVTKARIDYYGGAENLYNSILKDDYYYRNRVEGETPETLKLIEFTYDNVIKYRDEFNQIFGFYIFNEKRHDKRLLQAIDALGLEECSGDCAELAIAEIHTKRYKIKEYDGMESVSTFDDDNYYCIDD